jgi:hypothetical protein
MTYPWLSYKQARAYESEAKRLGVSVVARGHRGFMREYAVAGSSKAMSTRPLPTGVTGGRTWGDKRQGFISRHMQQYRKNPTYRRFLALTMWAYKPGRPPPVSTTSKRRRSRRAPTTPRRRHRK